MQQMLSMAPPRGSEGSVSESFARLMADHPSRAELLWLIAAQEPGPILSFATPDGRSAEEIARTREIHQSRKILGFHDLAQLFTQLGSSGSSVDAAKQEHAKSYIPRLEIAATAIRTYEANASLQAHLVSEALTQFRTIARSIEADVEDQHVLDSPESQLFTADYNRIMEALRIMFRRIPSEPGYYS